jgi:hypothetical protein
MFGQNFNMKVIMDTVNTPEKVKGRKHKFYRKAPNMDPLKKMENDREEMIAIYTSPHNIPSPKNKFPFPTKSLMI